VRANIQWANFDYVEPGVKGIDNPRVKQKKGCSTLLSLVTEGGDTQRTCYGKAVN